MHYVKAKGILSQSNGMNLYRGCQHGCIYCDSRSHCYQMTHAFEDIEVKENALTLLEQALKARKKPCMIGTGAMSDPYTTEDLTLGMTRKALELICKYGFGAAIQTKSHHILRDLDILTQINKQAKAVVQMTLTTYDEKLCRILEPNVSTTHQRYDTLCRFRDVGIPTIVWLCPLLPFINDTEENMLGILELCRSAGVKGIIYFGAGLTLRQGNREYFFKQLDRYFPGLKEQYIRLYGDCYTLDSPNRPYLDRFFHNYCTDQNIWHNNGQMFTFLHTLEEHHTQLSFF